jgi:hypothetical protein
VTAREAIARVFEGVDGPLTVPEIFARVRALPGGDRWTDASLRSILGALALDSGASRHAPAIRPHGFLFALGGGRYRRWNEVTDGSLEQARASGLPETAARPKSPSPAMLVPNDDLVRAYVDSVQAAPHQPRHRRVPHGDPVVGWPARAASYFWPHPVMDLRATHEVLSPWFEEAGKLSEQLGDGWNHENRRRAAILAWQMLSWGGVTRQKGFGELVVEEVFRRALGLPGGTRAPMSSGWTKVAALATAFLEGDPERSPHVIWDSRVSTSLVDRLEPVLVERGLDPSAVALGIGLVEGQEGAGTRPRPRLLKWPRGSRKWTAQEAGSAFVRRVRDVLNEGGYGRMPLPTGGEGLWTVRGVECVMFMDGY